MATLPPPNATPQPGYVPSQVVTDPADVLLACRNVNKWFLTPTKFHVLKDISLDVRPGEFATIMGRSGSGKTTLLYILSTLDTDYQGDLWLKGQHLKGSSERNLARIRNESFGFVFQFHYLLEEFSVLQNVMLPAIKLGRYSRAEIEARALEKLRLLGIEDQARKPASQLSGGQQQRVAIARALINDPAIILGDEPTGNLDSRNSDNIVELLRTLARDFGQTSLIVTHDDSIADRSDRVIWLKDGALGERGS
jgi:lipoprotein-releasing system ATP-binding protein